MGVVDNIFAKYFATVVGWLAVSRPFFDQSSEHMKGFSSDELYQEYHTRSRFAILFHVIFFKKWIGCFFLGISLCG